MLLVGREQVSFNIHEQRLRSKTAFFTLHRQPVQTTEFRVRVVGSPSENDGRNPREIDTIESSEPSQGPSSPSTEQSDVTVMPASASGGEMRGADGDDDRLGNPLTTAPDESSRDNHRTSSSHSAVVISESRVHTVNVYRLPDVGRAAFKTLCEWLYFGRPRVPTNVAQCKIMIDT